MTQPLRIGIVGCGRLAESGYAPALAQLPDLAVVAVADPDASRRSIVAALVGGAPAQLANATALVAAVELDAVLIASPVDHHIDDAAAAASSGLPALLEKPPARDAATARRLGALDPAPWLGFNRRFDPGAQQARRARAGLDSYTLDLVLHYRRAGWAPHQVDDDALLDLGPHLVDWARWIGGDILAVRCAELQRDHAVVELELTQGRAVIDVASDRPHRERLHLRDGTGQTVVDHRIGGVVAGVRARLRGGAGPSDLIATLRAELATFAHAVRTGDAGDLGAVTDGVSVMTVLDAARASAGNDRCFITPTIEERH